MKPSKREIHEQKCPDRLKCQIKYKHCPYDPLELIKEEEYESHILNCKSRPKISIEEQHDIERARTLNDLATEKEQILAVRETYYKGCVEEPEIPGLPKKKQKTNKKKQKFVKGIQKAFCDQEGRHIAALAEMVNDKEENEEPQNQNSHQFDFPGDQEYSFNEEEGKEGEEEIEKPNKKEDVNKIENNKNAFGNFNKISKKEKYYYDPNDEDNDITKDSANVIIPEIVYKILNQDGVSSFE
jgi:hypothetical protein